MAGISPRVFPSDSARADAEPFYLGAYLNEWHAATRHDLTASHSTTLSLSGLLALATPEERLQWGELRLDYASPRGPAAVRRLVATRYAGLTEDDVTCCAGAQEAMVCVARALLTAGDHAIVVTPIYQPLAWAVTDRAGATGVPLDPCRFTLDVGQVAAAIRPATRLVLVNTPNSPTGAALDAGTMAALVALCRHHGLWLVSDEVYRETTADLAALPPPATVAYERGVSISALSKGFGLPGLRVGWLACRDPALMHAVGQAKSALSSCLAAPVEMLALVALREEPRLIGQARALGAANRAALDGWLARHPRLFTPDLPGSLAFAFPSYLGADGADRFAAGLAAATGTLVLPSSVWRSPLAEEPKGRLRISLGQPNLQAGLDAAAPFLRTRV